VNLDLSDMPTLLAAGVVVHAGSMESDQGSASSVDGGLAAAMKLDVTA
jgi:hypothetical protein